MTEINVLSITIPDLLQNPYITQQAQINGQLYFMDFVWNIRQERAYFSLYIKQDNELKYLIKNICLIPSIVLSKNIKYEDWQGDLTFAPLLGSTETDYRQDNISTDFDIKYSYVSED